MNNGDIYILIHFLVSQPGISSQTSKRKALNLVQSSLL